MEILVRNLTRWILASVSSCGHGVTNVLVMGILFEFLPYGAGQQGSSDDPDDNGPSVSAPIRVFVMFMFFVFLIMAFCSILCRRFAYQSPPAITAGATTESGGGLQLWRGARGLDTEVIESFPTFLYSDVKELKIGKGGVECAVCLSEFADDETLRLMPPCSHVFHAKCIDVWLSTRLTCPVCRANLKLKPGDSFPSPVVDPNPGTDLETGNAGRRGLESPDRRLIESVTWTHNNRPPRSRSTGLSSWRITGMLFPRSHSTGHSPLRAGENLDRFTLQLPGEVRRLLMEASTLTRTRSSHVALPQARSSRRGYRSGSVGIARNAFPAGPRQGRRSISLSFSFSFRNASVRSSPSRRSDLAVTTQPKGLLRSIKSPFETAVQGKDEEVGERSFERLWPDGRD